MATQSQTFSDLSQQRVHFAREEEKILEYWREIDAFKKQLALTKGQKPWTFYDGPPFATGHPHYGHILAGTIKDVLCRYASQTGHHVERRFGWDTHGLPIEHKIETDEKIESREQVLEMGIRTYNSKCRAIVMRCADVWEETVERMGRWIDFKNDYKTLDLSFMESVWWVFKEMHRKELVYRGFKVMPYSTALNTPLSNFEAKSNYKTKKDPAVIVSFPIVDAPNMNDTSFLAWTTTPWTLPSNLALCVNEDLLYVKFKDEQSGKFYICGKGAFETAGKDNIIKKGDRKGLKLTVIEEFKGSALVGLKYVPLFNYFNDKAHTHCFRVVSDGYVSATAGTSIVHQAPGFGEDDLRVCQHHGVYRPEVEVVVCPVDHSGKYTEEVTDFVGKYVLDANKPILQKLRKEGRVWVDYFIEHEYPFCWRSDTPLIYRAIPSWYIAVEKIKDKLLANNQKTYWVPGYVKDKRFHNWLEDARDWAVSRNRYWGTPIPIWISEDPEEKDPEWIVVGSVEELAKLSGKDVSTITDLHRENVDDITIISPTTGKKLKRVDEVFDCWFESGSMPYGQCHYPFAFKGEEERFLKEKFPADFIAEGLDQTRGWFYTLLVISTALFDQPAWKNVVVNGLVLAADGKKMSKSKGNYPNPNKIFNEYGADALRLYLCNSPVVHGDPLRFQEEGVEGIVKDVLSPWYNVYKFFIENANRFERSNNVQFKGDMEKVQLKSVMDKWIVSELQSLIKFVRQEMEGYRLYTVVPELLKFIENLCNWYVRMNRMRIRGQTNDAFNDSNDSLSCLFHVLLNLTQLMAPLTPFIVETMYLNLKGALDNPPESVHFLNVPVPNEKLINIEIEKQMAAFQSVIQLGRNVRANTQSITSLKQPAKEILIFHPDQRVRNNLEILENEIATELNVKEVRVLNKIPDFMKLKCNGNVGALGKEFGKDRIIVSELLQKLTMEECFEFMDKGELELNDTNNKFLVKLEHVDIAWKFAGEPDLNEMDQKSKGKGKGKNKDKTKGKGGKKGKDKKEEEKVETVKIQRDPMADVYSFGSEKKYLVLMNQQITKELKYEGIAREVCNRIQKLRKAGGLKATDVVTVYYGVGTNQIAEEKENDLVNTMNGFKEFISNRTRVTVSPIKLKSEFAAPIVEDNTDIEGERLHLTLCLPHVYFGNESVVTQMKDSKLKDTIEQYLVTKDYKTLMEQYPKGTTLQVTVNDSKFDLVSGKDFSFEAKAL